MTRRSPALSASSLRSSSASRVASRCRLQFVRVAAQFAAPRKARGRCPHNSVTERAASGSASTRPAPTTARSIEVDSCSVSAPSSTRCAPSRPARVRRLVTTTSTPPSRGNRGLARWARSSLLWASTAHRGIRCRMPVASTTPAPGFEGAVADRHPAWPGEAARPPDEPAFLGREPVGGRLVVPVVGRLVADPRSSPCSARTPSTGTRRCPAEAGAAGRPHVPACRTGTCPGAND